MSELKHIRVRQAKIRDIGLFRKLWEKLLKQQEEKGSIVLVTEKTLKFYDNLFNLYTEGRYKGIVLFVADRGVLMWGDNDSPLDCSKKPAVMNWGCYTESEQENDIKKALWEYALKWAKEQKFLAVLSDHYSELDLPDDFKAVSTLMYKEL